VRPLDRLPLPLAHLPDDKLQNRLHDRQHTCRNFVHRSTKPTERLQRRAMLLH
jgi:hypothetical protein